MSDRLRDIFRKHYILPEESLGGGQDGFDRAEFLIDLETAAELSRISTRRLYATIAGAVVLGVIVVVVLGQYQIIATALLAVDGGLIVFLMNKLEQVSDKDTRTRMALVLARHVDEETVQKLIRISFDHYEAIGKPDKVA